MDPPTDEVAAVAPAEVRATVVEVRALVGRVDPDRWTGEQAEAALQAFDELERLAAAGRALASGRVASSGTWRHRGDRTAADAVARSTGRSFGEARADISLAAALDLHPELDAVVRAGEVSAAAARLIAPAVEVDADALGALVRCARSRGLRALRETAREVIARGEEPAARRRRVRAARSCRTWTDPDGTWRAALAGTVEDGARIEKLLDLHQRHVFAEARSAGARDPYEAYRFDALLRALSLSVVEPGAWEDGDAADGTTLPAARPTVQRSALRHAVLIRVDWAALRRGRVAAGETCEIDGVGPVGVDEVLRILRDDDPIVKALLVRGRDVLRLATLDRSLKDDLRLAVRERDRTCAVPGCDHRSFLDLDHEQPFARQGPGSYQNLRPLCRWHHRLRTTEGYDLRGPVGSREWVHPDGRVLAVEEPDP